MSKYKFINIIDILFITLACFFLNFAWSRFYINNIFVCIIASALITFFILTCINFISRKKSNKKYSSSKAKQETEEYIKNLQLAPTQKRCLFFKTLVEPKYKPHIINGEIQFTKEGEKSCVVFCFDAEKIGISSVSKLVQNKFGKIQNLYIVCYEAENIVKAFAKSINNIKVFILDKNDCYSLFIEKEKFPAFNLYNTKVEKIHFKDILKNSISKDKSKGYFISGIILLITSIIIPFSLYYIIFGSILIILSIISRLRKPSPKNKIIF